MRPCPPAGIASPFLDANPFRSALLATIEELEKLSENYETPEFDSYLHEDRLLQIPKPEDETGVGLYVLSVPSRKRPWHPTVRRP
jgi:hypothetical protein